MAKATIGSCDLPGSPPPLPKQIHQTGLVTHAGLVPCSNHFTAFYPQVNRKGKLARMRLEALDLRLRGFWNQVVMSRITPFTHEWTNGMLAERYAILPPPQVNASRSLPPLCQQLTPSIKHFWNYGLCPMNQGGNWPKQSLETDLVLGNFYTVQWKNCMPFEISHLQLTASPVRG